MSKRLEDYEKLYLKKSDNIFSSMSTKVFTNFINKQNEHFFWKNHSLDKTKVSLQIDTFDMKHNMNLAEENYSKLVTNNNMGIEDSYFDEYIKLDYNNLKNSAKDQKYTISKECDDLRLFLEVCREIGIDVELVSIPVNGYWYDYVGHSKEDRKEYYNNIQDISNAYQVKLFDLSKYEYEKGFLKDIMHLGWKGWIRINEEIYRFSKE